MRYISYVGPCCRTFNKNKKEAQSGQSKFTLKPGLTDLNEIRDYIKQYSNASTDELLYAFRNSNLLQEDIDYDVNHVEEMLVPPIQVALTENNTFNGDDVVLGNDVYIYVSDYGTVVYHKDLIGPLADAISRGDDGIGNYYTEEEKQYIKNYVLSSEYSEYAEDIYLGLYDIIFRDYNDADYYTLFLYALPTGDSLVASVSKVYGGIEEIYIEG